MLQDYKDFVRSFFTIADDRARAFVDRELNQQNRLWPDYLLQVSPSYERTRTMDTLADEDMLDREEGADAAMNKSAPIRTYPDARQTDANLIR